MDCTVDMPARSCRQFEDAGVVCQGKHATSEVRIRDEGKLVSWYTSMCNTSRGVQDSPFKISK